ncbi:MAG: DegT/DnrJ/EryC1/StrS family aminotransferase [Dissulfuribacterales bacterium]
MAVLAINGGARIRNKKFPAYNTIGAEEEEAVLRVLRSGKLSNYLGTWHDDFYGGTEVRALEQEWADYFGVRHAIAVNSATSGLYAAVGACGVGPGDEVIVSPYTMSASATAALIYGGIPVFADVEPNYFCLDPVSVESCITSRTKAIIVVDIFGLPYDADTINSIARKHGICVIEDCAQAPGATYNQRFAGTLGDIGVYSLNYHKHIHCGEGGVVVTNSDELAWKLRLIRNHAEAVLDAKGIKAQDELVNMVGFNYRMTEIEASIARCQLKKLDGLVKERRNNIKYLEGALSEIPCFTPASERPGSAHVYYVHPILFDSELAGVSRDLFIKAVKAELAPTEMREKEGVQLSCGYVKPLYLQPIYQYKIAFGQAGYPFNLSQIQLNYRRGLCPVTERLHFETLITHEFMKPPATMADLNDVIKAFWKVWENRHELYGMES